jgi:hypothetical protein
MLQVSPRLHERVRSSAPPDHVRSYERTSAHRLLVSLLYGRCLARLGLGARAVALTSAAHACRVALSWPAQLRESSLGGERLKRGLLCSK